jgi:hypothetical protein
MTGYGDVGAEIINRLATRLECDHNLITFWRHGLTWYPGGLTQHIWAEESPRQGGLANWRIHVHMWCLKRVVASSQQLIDAITAELPLNCVSALVRKPGSPSRLGLASSMWLTSDRIDWTSRLMAALARVQAHDALRLARAQPVLACGVAADVAHERVGADGAGGAPAPNVAAADMSATAFLASMPFVEIADAIRAHDGVRTIATHSGIAASFPWMVDGGRHDIMLDMRVATRQPFGTGIWVSLSLPMTASAQLLHAIALNEAELASASPTDVIGGWLVRNQMLMHESFVPWTLCSGSMVRHLAEAAVRRANWFRVAGRSILPGEWPDEARGRVLPFPRSS